MHFFTFFYEVKKGTAPHTPSRTLTPHTLAHTPSHTLTHPHTPSHTLTHPHTPSHTLTHPHTPSHHYTLTHLHTLTPSRTYHTHHPYVSHALHRILDPLLAILLDKSTARVNGTYQTMYDARRVVYVFRVLKVIIYFMQIFGKFQ
jgi:hypothetical protein